MTLIVETGQIVDGANSYVTAQEVNAYAHARGIHNLPTGQQLVHLIILACDALDAKNWAGELVQVDQPLAWPRAGMSKNCKAVSAGSIPSEIKTAQILMTLALAQGVDLMPIHGTDNYASKSVGSVSVSLGKSRSTPYMPQINSLINGYLRRSLRVVRA